MQLAEGKKRAKNNEKLVIKKVEKNEKNQREKKKRVVMNELMDKGYKRMRKNKVLKPRPLESDESSGGESQGRNAELVENRINIERSDSKLLTISIDQ